MDRGHRADSAGVGTDQAQHLDRSFLVLRQEIPTYVGDELQSTSNSADLSDHRVVNGVQMPFSVAITVPLLGRVALTYENVALNSPIDPQVFDQLLP